MSDPGVRTMLAVRGSMVAVSSIAALRAPSGSAAYAVSKAGLVMPARIVARDFAARGVRANVVCPGWVRTQMADQEMARLVGRSGSPGTRPTPRSPCWCRSSARPRPPRWPQR